MKSCSSWPPRSPSAPKNNWGGGGFWFLNFLEDGPDPCGGLDRCLWPGCHRTSRCQTRPRSIAKSTFGERPKLTNEAGTVIWLSEGKRLFRGRWRAEALSNLTSYGFGDNHLPLVDFGYFRLRDSECSSGIAIVIVIVFVIVIVIVFVIVIVIVFVIVIVIVFVIVSNVSIVVAFWLVRSWVRISNVGNFLHVFV